MPEAAPRILEQVGYDYPYAADGNDGPAVLPLLEWGARDGEVGRVIVTPTPLFPRIESEAVEPTPA
jgi:hypothetical protein